MWSTLHDNMTIHQLESLTEEELSMILYIFNRIYPIYPDDGVTKNLLLSVKNDYLRTKMVDVKSQISDEGMTSYNSLISKLNIKE